ncbi:Uncharacterised protein [Mycobacterium tuberculosis]|nr:Uncharacterised protein [Mycobacterium tuberculosis]CNL96809.1 Uncharacterised protein [Mycobacterium tuberculosis]
MDQSSRGHPAGSAAVGSTPTRPAAMRPVSSTMTTRRSRSGRQVRTMTSARRALARQSIERTSSPTTYSRSESNSVPWPRINVGNSPSISRSLASLDGRCLRDRNGGSTRTKPGTDCELCRPANPSGPIERAVTIAARWSPRRTGRSAVCTCWRCPAATSTSWVCGCARALGGQASRTWPRNRRRPPLQSSRLASTGCPSRAEVYGERVKRNLRVLAASRVSTVTATASATSNITKALAGQGDSAIGRTQIRASKPVRPVRIICAALPRKRVGVPPTCGGVPPPHRFVPRKRVVPPLHRRRRRSHGSLAGHRNRGQNSVENAVGCGAFQLGFRA